MGGDIFIQIYTGVSTRPSTSRPLLAAYAVRRNAYEACGAPTCLYHGVCMHTWIIIARKKICIFKQLLKIISRADYLLAISHVCIGRPGNRADNPFSSNSNSSSHTTTRTTFSLVIHRVGSLFTIVIGQSMDTSMANDHMESVSQKAEQSCSPAQTKNAKGKPPPHVGEQFVPFF